MSKIRTSSICIRGNMGSKLGNYRRHKYRNCNHNDRILSCGSIRDKGILNYRYVNLLFENFERDTK